VVARLLKKHSNTLYANDLETYSKIINECYLTNKEEFDENLYDLYKRNIEEEIQRGYVEGLFSKYYAPLDDGNIKKGERVFYTRRNALYIDTFRLLINEVAEDYQKYFLAPLLYEASVHVNTAGVFKGFYKDVSTGIGKFGGVGENALPRIKGKIEIKKPIFSNFSCQYCVFQKDANELVKELPFVDLAYIDPPYNQHPYGSNYFMLNLIISNKLEGTVSRVSGIPGGWNRSNYNKKKNALIAFDDLIKNLKAKYAIISYNSEGFIGFDDMLALLKNYGKVRIKEITYNAYRGSRNLQNRSLYVSEYLFVLQKEMI